MNLLYFLLLIFIILSPLNFAELQAPEQESAIDLEPLQAPPLPIAAEDQKNSQQETAQPEKLIPFSFQNEPLASIVHMMASHKKINIILPADATFKTQKVTFHNDKELPIDVAWNVTQTFLDLAGYTISKRASTYTIVPTANNAYFKEVLPLYINVPPDKLPLSDQRIRAVFYLNNLTVPTAPTATTFGVPTETATNPISLILNDMTSPNSTIYDPTTNAIIITEKANTIASAMKVIYALDEAGLQETVEIVQLFDTSARTVADFFRNSIFGAGGGAQQPAYYGAPAARPTRTGGAPYFASVSIVNDDRTNSLIILGRQEAVDRIKEFIEDIIDVPAETGESILHTYDLQYLDSKTFAPILQQIITPGPAVAGEPGAAAQFGQATVAAAGAGPLRFFENPIIAFETYEQIAAQTPQGEGANAQPQLGPLGSSADGTSSTGLTQLQQQQPPYQGGNRLIIAARHTDWDRIHDLIEKLDRPQDQVLVETLIVNITHDTTKALQSTIRNPSTLRLAKGVRFEAAHLPAFPDAANAFNPDALVYNGSRPDGSTPVVTGDSLGNVDLLRFLVQNPAATLASNPPTDPGSLLISVKDPNTNAIAEVLRILRATNDVQVIQRPYTVITNNQQATLLLQDIRRDIGDPVAGSGGVTTTPQIDIMAQLQVQITPRISSAKRANLQLNIAVSQFTAAANTGDNTRNEKAVQTNVNMSTDQVLALGGLTSVNRTVSTTTTPILGRIPILGWLFRGNRQEIIKSDLLILLNISIFSPKAKDVPVNYTTRKLCGVIEDFQDGMVFDSFRDPITRIFFNHGGDRTMLIDDYLDQTDSSINFRFCGSKKKKAPAAKNEKLPAEKTRPKKPTRKERERLRSLVTNTNNPLAVAA